MQAATVTLRLDGRPRASGTEGIIAITGFPDLCCNALPSCSLNVRAMAGTLTVHRAETQQCVSGDCHIGAHTEPSSTRTGLFTRLRHHNRTGKTTMCKLRLTHWRPPPVTCPKPHASTPPQQPHNKRPPLIRATAFSNPIQSLNPESNKLTEPGYERSCR